LYSVLGSIFYLRHFKLNFFTLHYITLPGHPSNQQATGSVTVHWEVTGYLSCSGIKQTYAYVTQQRYCIYVALLRSLLVSELTVDIELIDTLKHHVANHFHLGCEASLHQLSAHTQVNLLTGVSNDSASFSNCFHFRLPPLH